MTDDDFKKSTANLKQAVPLMIKNHVAATPANYALWYTYVDNSMPQLNEEMDAILANFDLFPPATGEHLYKTHIATRAETSVSELRNNIELLANEICCSMSDTMTDTSAFEAAIDKSLNDLERVEHEELSIEEVMMMIRQFVSESHDIRHSTRFLNNQLQSASQEISRLKAQLATVQRDALFDSLSGLYNRRAFNDDLAALMHGHQPMSIILLDIDHFKRFNDEFGHLFGDNIIRSLGKRLQASCREGITAYRFGGEEFALILPNKSLRSARQFADTLRRSIEKLKVRDRRNNNQVGNITASFGVSQRDDLDSAQSLLDRADQMLYDAKHLGRNRVMPI
ncbi:MULTISPECIES: GGDEF domain-containing protein [Vibrio]|uniref:diguanylate cyclase n=1 Tax=Vibrio ostreae TaxID=2841925 RepID=A0A975YLD5_9VIBR|nr:MULTISPECIES: GGDEF domain-containing protein [Vibrio]QXO15542.1 GGDEF domain-containing protein [Vibrio ostreae]WGY45490.1 GGDEF domain-containing protein [Vibrio sp. ABG19]